MFINEFVVDSACCALVIAPSVSKINETFWRFYGFRERSPLFIFLEIGNCARNVKCGIIGAISSLSHLQ